MAGIFDAEGYVRIRHTNQFSYTPEVRIYMCDKRIVDMFGRAYGVKTKSVDRGKDRKLAHWVSLGVKELKSTTFIADILPYLNEKRIQLLQVDYLLGKAKPKDECYQDYMLAKDTFDHPIIGKPDYEYIAGVVDGDGWFTMFNSGKFDTHSILNRFSFGLEQRYKPMIDYMTQFGGHVTTRPIKDKDNHRQTYEWKMSTRDMLPLLRNIEPHLIEKRERCQDFIKYIEKCNELDELSKELLKK